MTQIIKPNDLVFIPSITSSICKIYTSNDMLYVDDGSLIHRVNKDGQRYDTKLSVWITQPFAFLATPEMKEKLEQVYGELEDIPVDEEVEKFSKALNELSTFYTKLYSSDGNFRPSDKLEKLKSIKSNLIQMFKERGSK